MRESNSRVLLCFALLLAGMGVSRYSCPVLGFGLYLNTDDLTVFRF